MTTTRKIRGSDIEQTYSLYPTRARAAAACTARGWTMIELHDRSRLVGILGYDMIPHGQPLPIGAVVVPARGPLPDDEERRGEVAWRAFCGEVA